MATKDHPFYHKMPLTDQDQNPNPNRVIQDELDDESDDTVSLCDLPMYGNNTIYITSDSEDSMKEDESFEFYSEEWMKNPKDSNFFPHENIVFCGNLILPKQPISGNSQEFKKDDRSSGPVDGRKSEGSDFRPAKKWINHGGEYELKRVSPAMASKKSRWYYYGVGLAGVPPEMDLGGIKSRQHRRRKIKNPSGGSESGNRKEKTIGKGLGRLIRDLSCNGQTQANSMVKASLVCIPRV